MKAPAKLAAFVVGLTAVFGASLWVGGAVVPRDVASSWSRAAAAGHGAEHAGARWVRGVSLSEGDLMLAALTAPTTVETQGTLSFRVGTLTGGTVTGFSTENTEQMHLIVVRSDGTEYRHVHPTMNADGRWSIPWAWDAAGTYRAFADFVPAETGTGTVLSDTIEVAGVFTPRRPAAVSSVSRIDGFTVTIDGALQARATSTLTATVTRDGKPVTALQPYLGASGHLVVLREGDLAYLHAHPESPPAPTGSGRGPQISFLTEAPTPGRYLLYLDFQVNGQVHTAAFAVYAGDSPATHQ